jgi:hypothetical protein
MVIPRCTQPCAAEYVHTCTAWLPGAYTTLITPSFTVVLDCDASSRLIDPALASTAVTVT